MKIQSFFRQLMHKPLCNFLSIVCISIASCFIILIFNLSFDTSNIIGKQYEEYDTVIVFSNGEVNEYGGLSKTKSIFSNRKLNEIVDINPEIEYGCLSTDINRDNLIQYNKEIYRLRKITCSEPDIFQMYNLKILKGSFFTEQDLINNSHVAVINESTAKILFSTVDKAIGKTFYHLKSHHDMNGEKIEKVPFKIIGVIEDPSYFESTIIEIGDMIVPITSFLKKGGVEKIILKTSKKPNQLFYDRIEDQIKRDISQRTNILHWKGSIETPHLEKSLELKKEEIGRATMFFNFLGMIILLVGGFSIFGSMISKAMEKKRTIGLKRALGFTQRRIIVDIIYESLFFTIAGSVIGSISAMLLNRAFMTALLPVLPANFSNNVQNNFLNIKSIIFGLLITVVIGTLFSFFSAIISSKTSPVESLRDL